jgi:transcription elongation factor Elf1
MTTAKRDDDEVTEIDYAHVPRVRRVDAPEDCPDCGSVSTVEVEVENLPDVPLRSVWCEACGFGFSRTVEGGRSA